MEGLNNESMTSVGWLVDASIGRIYAFPVDVRLYVLNIMLDVMRL